MKKQHKHNNHRRYVANCYTTLKELDLIDTQNNFSQLFLDKHRSYYSSVMARDGINFSINSLSCLVSRLKIAKEQFVKTNEEKEKLKYAYLYGLEYLTKRISKIKIPGQKIVILEV